MKRSFTCLLGPDHDPWCFFTTHGMGFAFFDDNENYILIDDNE